MRFSNKFFTLIPPKNLRPFSQHSTTTTPTQHFSEKIISPESQSSKPSSQNQILDTLFRYKSKPESALKFFQNLEKKRGFVKTVDVFCLLLQILSSSPKTHGSVQVLVYHYVSGNAIPCAKVIVEQLLECSGRYGFESDSRVFNYLLRSFVEVDKITDAVECFRTMLEHDVIPRVPIMNTLLTAMVRRNMISDACELYDEMVERGICGEGDCCTLDVLMRACLNQGKFEEAQKFFEEAKVRGLELDAAAYSIVVQVACNQLDSQLTTTTPPTQHFPEKIISPQSQSSEPSSQNKFLDKLLRHKSKPKLALEFFENVERKRGFVKTIDAFCLLLQILSSTPKTHSYVGSLLNRYVSSHAIPRAKVIVEELLECSRRYGFESDSRVFNYFLNCFVRVNKITDAVECFRTMLEHDVIPWIPITNKLLTAMVRRNMISDARELYDQMVERGIYGDCYTLHVLMRVCLKEREFEKAEKLFEEAKGRGLKLDAAAYSIVVKAVCSRLDLNLACQLLKEMRELGWVPSEGTYTTVILACVKQGNFVEALRLKDEMVSSGLRTNVVVACRLMNGHCARGEVNLALKLFDEIVESGVDPDVGMFSLLINGFSKIGNMEKSYELYTQMKLLGVQPTADVVNFLLKGFWKQNLLQKAHGLLDLLEKAHRLLDEAVELGIADVVSYNIILLWLCEIGKVNEACNLWDKMMSKGITPSRVSYNNLILGYCKKGCMDDAYSLLNNILERGLKPNAVTYTLLIDGFFKKGDSERGFVVFEQMMAANIAPPDHTVNTVINGLCKTGQVSKTQDKLNDFITKDVVEYGALIDGFCKMQDMESASKFFTELLDVGLTPNAVVYNSMISGFLHLNNMEAALNLHQKMIMNKIPSRIITGDISTGKTHSSGVILTIL
ncbi:hypothetical protein TSUD_265020 [Trifolium subterraneum]|uniref:PROP1-like PPR domain-containing protein n=1 Tax=Trifolium subterraneum TaxID=3900 RepID=A0A2Z6M6N2_TRISU|nr:hypothetical protein TSUD_265020 [Trifolium subterraneum]